MMIKRTVLLAALLTVSAAATAQDTSIVGTWVLTAADKLLPDGKRVPDFGPNPHGLAIFTADGHYSVQIYSAQPLQLPSDDNSKGALQAYKDVLDGMSVHFGRFTVDSVKHTITFQVDRASFPAWDDTTQVRSYELQGDALSWKVARRPDGSTPITALRRVR